MRVSDNWVDYEVIDTSSGEKLERWKNVVLVRPDPQIIWKTDKKNDLWENAHAYYRRASDGGGKWKYNKPFKESWVINYNDLSFKIKPTGFKHTGLFPEQSVNWDFFIQKINKQDRQIKVLNLFAYTGGATLACLSAGASVCHVDASKGMVNWAKENALLSGLTNKDVRWIVDDCQKFIQREIKRGNKYDAIIMDPPSYGRGPNGEVWRLEDNVYDLIKMAVSLLSYNPLFFAVNSYTTGLSSSVMDYILKSLIKGGSILSGEIGLKVKDSGMVLPCGNTSIWQSL
ncbi:MAG: class I SAM-dependent methyltransferase [Oscillospiraceae bacterium]